MTRKKHKAIKQKTKKPITEKRQQAEEKKKWLVKAADKVTIASIFFLRVVIWLLVVGAGSLVVWSIPNEMVTSLPHWLKLVTSVEMTILLVLFVICLIGVLVTMYRQGYYIRQMARYGIGNQWKKDLEKKREGEWKEKYKWMH